MKKNIRGLMFAGGVLLKSLLYTGCGSTASVQAQNSLMEDNDAALMQEITVQNTTDEMVLTQDQPLEDEVAEEIESGQEEEERRVSLVMVGDVLLHEKVTDSGRMEDGSYHYNHLFTNIKEEVESADIALVNQEVILGGRELGLSGYPCFNGAYEVGDSLVNAGFDVILHATNHALDKGSKGLLNCINFWRDRYPDVAVLGIHDSQEAADDIYVTEYNGIRIAILNYTYGTNGISMPKGMPYAVDLWNEAEITDDMARAGQEADFIIVCPHWGTEYQLEESADQRAKAQFLADLGADLIIGTHPHVIEPVEWIQGAAGNETLVYYSLGNYINATSGTGSGTAARMVGAMAQVTISMDDEEAYISEYGVEPLVTHNVSGTGQITTYRLSDYTEELASANEMRRQDASFSLSYCQSLCRQVLGELYE